MAKVLVKKLDPKVKLPAYKTNGASGMDLMAFTKNPINVKPKTSSMVPTGLTVAFSENYEIQIALAGFSKSELDITVEDGNLVVKGEQEKSEDDFLHKGIAERNFTRTWALADDVKVTGSKLKDGVLSISLVHEIPEEKKPTSIEIK